MRKLNKGTQKAACFIYNYEHSNATHLRDVYSSYSRAKEEAYNYCIRLMRKLDGYNGRITAAGCQVFSFAFKYRENGIEKLAYITRNYDYSIEL